VFDSGETGSLHPILAMLMLAFPDALEVESDTSLIVVDRARFSARELGLDLSEPAIDEDDIDDEAYVDDLEQFLAGDVPLTQRADPAQLVPPAPIMCRVCHAVPVDHPTHMCQACKDAERQAALAARNPSAMPVQRPAAPTPKPPKPRPAPSPSDEIAEIVKGDPTLADRDRLRELAAKAGLKLTDEGIAKLPPPPPVQLPENFTIGSAFTPIVEHDAKLLLSAGGGVPVTVSREAIVIPGEGESPPLIPDEGYAIAEMMSNGMPKSVPIIIHPNVQDLWGFDQKLAVDAVRHPFAVELDTTFKQRNFPVLRFRRGDLYVVVGFKDRQNPAMLGVYVDPALEHDTHRVHHTGSGGARRLGGKPTNYGQLVLRISRLGVEIGEPDPKGIAELMYRGQSLGKIKVEGIAKRDDVTADWDRVQRRVQAIERRQPA